MVIALALAAVLVVLALGAAFADRALVGVAEHRASAYLSEPFGHPPTVRVHGTPFLTQALRGCYREIAVSGGGLRVGEMAGATLNARLHNVHLPARELLGRRVRSVRCDQIAATIVLPYGELARIARIPGLALSLERSRLLASAALPIPGLGQLARVSGEAELSLDGAGGVRLRVRRLAVAGISLPGLVLQQLLPSLDVRIAVPSLPYGLHLDSLEPTAAGLLVSASAVDVLLRRDPDE